MPRLHLSEHTGLHVDFLSAYGFSVTARGRPDSPGTGQDYASPMSVHFLSIWRGVVLGLRRDKLVRSSRRDDCRRSAPVCSAPNSVSALRAVSAWGGMLRTQRFQPQMQVGFGLSIGDTLAASILVVLAFGSAKVLAGALTIGGLVAFYTYGTRVFEPISSAMEPYSRLQSVGSSIQRVRELLDLESTLRNTGTERLEGACLAHGFEIQDVSFSYGRKAALSNFTFQIGAGERVAIIGASGSGKSTLARLLVRAADPDCGRILLERLPLADYTLASLRSAVCYVPQHPVLFQGTIRGNLLYANPRASDEEMLRAVEAVQLASVLNRLPQGLDASLGPGAISLSGGERQRLSMARSLLRESAALVLDEATSALDVPTERKALESVANFRTHQTIIVISHRLRSLAWVDRFVLLDQGRIVATGTHSALYPRSALYRSLYDASAQDLSAP